MVRSLSFPCFFFNEFDLDWCLAVLDEFGAEALREPLYGVARLLWSVQPERGFQRVDMFPVQRLVPSCKHQAKR